MKTSLAEMDTTVSFLLLVLTRLAGVGSVEVLEDWALPTVVQKGDKVNTYLDISQVFLTLIQNLGGPEVQLQAGGGEHVQPQVVSRRRRDKNNFEN